MAPEDDWSDSDEEVLSDAETSVHLGVPDGPIESSSDILDAAVSRIGGHPVRDIFRPCMCRSLIEIYPHFFCTFFFSLPYRRFLPLMNPSTLPRLAKTADRLWSLSSSCGARLKTVPMTESCMYGDVHVEVVKVKIMEGE